MNSIDKLAEIFSHFPGIGPRQARRFVYYLLGRSGDTINEFINTIASLKKEIRICKECMRFFHQKYNSDSCNICSDKEREENTLIVVSRDTDIEPIERSSNYNGKYFVLGGTIPVLDKEPEKRIRLGAFEDTVKNKIKNGLSEIILAMNWNPEGEYTGEFIEKRIKADPILKSLKITHLGKGLSMGTELEYADPDTLKNALRNRA